MAGHSKWAQIKRKKAVTDARRGQLWTRLLREVMVAARMGGGDPEGNARLRTAIQEARAKNVPNDNIERAVKKGTGELEGTNYEEIVYEGYGPGGVAVLVQTMTDNRNRTVAELRHLFAKSGGNLGETGSVSWQFEHRGYFMIAPEAMAEEAFMDVAIELGADDIEIGEDAYEIFTAPEAYGATLDELLAREVALEANELGMIPKNLVKLEGKEASRVLTLMDALDELDDVQHAWANLDIDAANLTADGG